MIIAVKTFVCIVDFLVLFGIISSTVVFITDVSVHSIIIAPEDTSFLYPCVHPVSHRSAHRSATTHCVKFEDVEMRYPKDLEPALRDMSLVIISGEHIGICGRTGAGNRTTIQCLFCVYELERRRILIDDLEMDAINLYDNR